MIGPDRPGTLVTDLILLFKVLLFILNLITWGISKYIAALVLLYYCCCCCCPLPPAAAAAAAVVAPTAAPAPAAAVVLLLLLLPLPMPLSLPLLPRLPCCCCLHCFFLLLLGLMHLDASLPGCSIRYCCQKHQQARWISNERKRINSNFRDFLKTRWAWNE